MEIVNVRTRTPQLDFHRNICVFFIFLCELGIKHERVNVNKRSYREYLIELHYFAGTSIVLRTAKFASSCCLHAYMFTVVLLG